MDASERKKFDMRNDKGEETVYVDQTYFIGPELQEPAGTDLEWCTWWKRKGGGRDRYRFAHWTEIKSFLASLVSIRVLCGLQLGGRIRELAITSMSLYRRPNVKDETQYPVQFTYSFKAKNQESE